MPPKQGQQSSQQNPKQQVAHFKPGQVPYTTLEGIPEGAPMMTGMFSINDQLVTVLFDSVHLIPLLVRSVLLDLGWV